jgi:hypothetical protein
MENQGVVPSPRRAKLRWVAIQAAAFVTTTVAGAAIEDSSKWIARAIWHLLRGLL